MPAPTTDQPYPGVPPGVTLRDPTDYDALRTDIQERVRGAYLQRFPIENDRVRLELTDAEYDPKKRAFGVHDAKRALLEDGSLRTPLRGNFRLTDKATGQTLDEKKLTFANVPTPSHRGTFIINGVEYAAQNQMRLRAGIYSRRKDNGELETHLNSKSGTGPQMRLHMEPDTGVFRMGLQQSQSKFYPLAKAIGITDEQLYAAWGPEILAANQEASRTSASRTLGRFHDKLLRGKGDPNATDAQKGADIAQKFGAIEFDPEVNQRTLATPHNRLTNAALLDASKKLLKVHRGEAEGDDRDSLANKTFHSADDFLEERVRKDAGRLGSSLLWKAGYNRNLDHLRPGYFTPQLQEFVVGNSLSGAIPGINAMELRDANYRLTSMGEGGLGSADAVPLSSRNVSPTHYGFVDPIRSSESHMIGIDLRLARKIKKGSDNQVYAPFRNRRTGQTEWLNPTQLAGKSLAFADADTLAPHVTSVTPQPQPTIFR